MADQVMRVAPRLGYAIVKVGREKRPHFKSCPKCRRKPCLIYSQGDRWKCTGEDCRIDGDHLDLVAWWKYKRGLMGLGPAESIEVLTVLDDINGIPRRVIEKE